MVFLLLIGVVATPIYSIASSPDSSVSLSPSSLNPSPPETSVNPPSTMVWPVVSCLGTACSVESFENGTEVSNCPPGFFCELQTVLPSFDENTSDTSANSSNSDPSLSIQFSCVGYPDNVTEQSNFTWEYDLSQPPCRCEAQWIRSTSCQCQGCPGSTFEQASTPGLLPFLVTCLDSDNGNTSVVVNECPFNQSASSQQGNLSWSDSAAYPPPSKPQGDSKIPAGETDKTVKPVDASRTTSTSSTSLDEASASRLSEQSTSGTTCVIALSSLYISMVGIMLQF